MPLTPTLSHEGRGSAPGHGDSVRYLNKYSVDRKLEKAASNSVPSPLVGEGQGEGFFSATRR
jgi:hypothetical protein